MSAVLQALYSTTHEKLDTFARLGDLLVHYWSLFLAAPVLLSAARSCDWHAILCVMLTLLVVHKLSKHVLEACRRGTRRESRTDILTIPGARDRMAWADAHGLLREALQTRVPDNNLHATNLIVQIIWRDRKDKRHCLAMNHNGYMIAQPCIGGHSPPSSKFRLCVSHGTDEDSVPISLRCDGCLVELQNYLALDPFSWFCALCPGECKPQTTPVQTISLESCQYQFVSGAAAGRDIRIYSSTHKTWLGMHRSILRKYWRCGDDYPCGVVDQLDAARFEVNITVLGASDDADGRQAQAEHDDQPSTGLSAAGDRPHVEPPADQSRDSVAADVDDWTAVAAPNREEVEAYHPELEYAGAAALAN